MSGRVRGILAAAALALTGILAADRALAADGDSGADLITCTVNIDSLDEDGGRFGPYALRKGDLWSADLAWSGSLDSHVYVANQLTGLGETWHTGQLQMSVGNALSASSFIAGDGDYWFFVGGRDDESVSNVEGTITVDPIGTRWAAGSREETVPVRAPRLDGGGEIRLGPYRMERGDQFRPSVAWEGGGALTFCAVRDGDDPLCAPDAKDNRIAPEQPLTIREAGDYRFVLRCADGPDARGAKNIEGELFLTRK